MWFREDAAEDVTHKVIHQTFKKNYTIILAKGSSGKGFAVPDNWYDFFFPDSAKKKKKKEHFLPWLPGSLALNGEPNYSDLWSPVVPVNLSPPFPLYDFRFHTFIFICLGHRGFIVSKFHFRYFEIRSGRN